MNWAFLRPWPWLDTRARFVAGTPRGGSLLDLGSSDGETLGHFAQLRPDLHLFAVDRAGSAEAYPAGCQFQRADLESDRLTWPDASMDRITCMHLVEHLNDLTLLLAESARVLKPGGRIYFETPHPRTVSFPSPAGPAAGTFTLNFYDDLTHVRPVSAGGLAQRARHAGLEILSSGTSRNWLFAGSYPLWFFLPPCRKKFTARIHWAGWSSYVIAGRPS